MSDTPQGPGWWQASDGRWYPPQPGVGGYPGPSVPVRAGTNPWVVVGWIVGILVLLPCAIGVGIFAIGALTSSPTTTTTTPKPGVTSGSGSGSGSGSSSGTAGPERSGPGGAGGVGQKGSPAPIGTEVMAAKDWYVTVTAAEPNADATLLAINQFNTPSPGKQYVLVTVKVENRSDRPEAVFSNVKFSLLTTSGAALSTLSCLAQVPDRLATSTELQPGGTVTGRMCFEATAAEVDGALLLAEPIFTLDTLADQRFFAIR